MFAARLGLGFLLLGGAAVAQQYVISTVAGGAPPPSPIPALSAPLLTDNGIATDVFGNAYIASFACVFRLGLDGMLTLVVGDCRDRKSVV